MGQAIDSLLIYGKLFTVEEIQKIMKLFGITDEELEDSFCDAFYKFTDHIAKKEFPSLYIGRGSPYYDSDWEEWTIYVSIHDPVVTEMETKDLKTLISLPLTEYNKFLAKSQLEGAPPSLYSITHVW